MFVFSMQHHKVDTDALRHFYDKPCKNCFSQEGYILFRTSGWHFVSKTDLLPHRYHRYWAVCVHCGKHFRLKPQQAKRYLEK